MDDVPQDANPTTEIDHKYREPFSCFAANANVQQTTITAGVFSQNKPLRQALTKLQPKVSDEQSAFA
jgi:hypothetical protein